MQTHAPTCLGGRPRLGALTGLRFLTALHIVAFHFGDALAVLPAWLYRILAAPGGVGLFFVLSGFILVYAQVDARGTIQEHARAFWFQRFARLYPVYLLGLGLSLPFYLETLALRGATPFAAFAEAAAVLTLVQAWWPAAALAWNFPVWAVSTMAFFYLVFPTLFNLTHRASSAALGLLVLPLLFLQPLAHAWLDSQAADPLWLAWVTYFPPWRLPEFLIGILCGHLFVRGRGTAPRSLAAPPDGKAVTALAGIAVFAVMAAGHETLGLLLYRPLLLAAFALLVYGLARGSGPVGQWLALPTTVRLGDASYALYVLQWPLWAWLERLIGMGDDLRSFLLYLACLLGSALVVLAALERPARRLLSRMAARRQGSGPL